MNDKLEVPDEFTTEEFYMRILLVHGGDPEAYLSRPQEKYRHWLNDVQNYAEELGVANCVFNEWCGGFYNWLSDHELGYDYRKDENHDRT